MYITDKTYALTHSESCGPSTSVCTKWAGRLGCPGARAVRGAVEPWTVDRGPWTEDRGPPVHFLRFQ